MRRYIDADILKNKTTRVNHIWNGTTNAEGKGLDEIIDDIPTADVVEVVRCKDCKYATYDKSIDRYDCRNWELDGDEYTEADDFCSYGERADT